MRSYFLLNILMPLIIGGLLYLCFRGNSIVFKTWLPDRLLRFHSTAPRFVAYNLPDALWLYSILSLLEIIWRNNPRIGLIWMTAVFISAILTEFLQAKSIIRGTFDLLDILAYSLSFSLILILHFIKINQHHEKKTFSSFR